MAFSTGIFDLDGTVIDSMGVWRKIDVEFLGKRGLVVPDDYLKAITPLGFDAAAEYTIERFHFQEKKEDIIEEWLHMALDAYANDVVCKDGAKEYLEWLKGRGIKLAVATSSDEALFTACLKNNGIYDLFDTFVQVKEVKRGKGYPDIYEEAARRLGAHVEECVVFEDILAGIKGAKDGGFYAVAMYDKDSCYEHEEMKKRVDYFAMNWMEKELHALFL